MPRWPSFSPIRPRQAWAIGPLSAAEREAVERTLQRIEAALRARAVANA